MKNSERGQPADARIHEFGEYRVDTGKRVLFRGGRREPLTPKVFDTLLFMLRHPGEILEKDVLMRAVWPDTVVEENNLSQNIATLRRVLQERRGENRYIETVPGRGYRFLADVLTTDTDAQDRPLRARLAVLPFENLSRDPERDYLADGLTEETITALGRVEPAHLAVIGRTSVMVYRKTTKSASDIGRELDVGYLVEGSIRGEGGRLRVTAKLVRVRDQTQVWSATFDSEPRSMLELQCELAGVIAEQIRLRLSPARIAALANRQTRHPDAFDHYLRGRYLWHQLTPDTTKRALEHYACATRFDSDYALAWSGIADAWCAAPITGDAAPRAVVPQARRAVEQAIRAHPDLAESQASLGFLNFWLEWRWPAAEAAFKSAIELDPNYAFAHRMLGLLYSHVGWPRDAAASMRRLRELEPLLAVNQALSAQVAFADRDFAAAAQFARQAIVIDPHFWVGHFQLAQACVELGDDGAALAALDDAARASGGNSKVVALRGYLHARRGRASEARTAVAALEAIARERYVPACAIALVYAGLDDAESAIEWLGRAYDARDVHLLFVPIDRKWDALRDDPRTAELLARCRFAIEGATASAAPKDNVRRIAR
jgi:TolB-like protein